MSWDAHLIDDRGHEEGWWNYTHNTSSMIYAVLEDAGIELAPDTRPCWAHPLTAEGKLTHYPNGKGTIAWWEHLNGLDGPEGAEFIGSILKGLRADPARFEAMNPPNGWGTYDGIVKVLTEMHDAVPEWPTRWSASG